MKDLKTYIQIFRDFVLEYRYENEADQRNIDLKLYHTERVLEIAQYLIEHLKSVIKPELIPLVELSALFHDIGRFEQYRQF
nr:HD domain-containing protein [Candidatus Cloacimonadota bacterium]